MCTATSLFSTDTSLSDSARISLLTCSPGDELYSCFGHSGIRVTDYKQDIDVVFNYGTFDFGQPNFYLNFAKGHMIYMLGVDRFQDFREQYVYEQRSIYEQQIALSNDEQKKVFDFLLNNSKVENRNYRYDFLYDNCATRILTVFEKTLSPNIQFDFSTFTERKSFRDLINDYSMSKPWEQFGMGILIGLPVDKITTPRQKCFLPDYISRAFAHATMRSTPLCQPIQKILSIEALHHPKTLDQIITPNIAFGILLLLILALSLWELKRKVHYYAIDYILFFIAGLLGTLFFILSSFTEHTTTAWNLNILWALPTHLLAAITLPFAKNKKWLKYYFLLSAFLACSMVMGWKLLPQQFLIANIFIAAIYMLRSLSLFKA